MSDRFIPYDGDNIGGGAELARLQRWQFSGNRS
jgi:hypothetical protein